VRLARNGFEDVADVTPFAVLFFQRYALKIATQRLQRIPLAVNFGLRPKAETAQHRHGRAPPLHGTERRSALTCDAPWLLLCRAYSLAEALCRS
jgi:hypothetical protein